MNIYTGDDCTGLTHYDCIEDSIGMPTAYLSGFDPGDTVYIRMYGDQAKSGTFAMCASDPTLQIEGHTGPAGVGDDSTNVLWLRADMAVLNNSDSEASNGEAVKTWQDRSGNANHVSQSTGSQQAVLTDNVIDGMPVLRMDGTDDFMSAGLSGLSAPLTLFTVSRFTASNTDDCLLSIGDEVSTDKTVSISRENDDRYYSYTNSAKWYGPALADDSVYLVHAVHNIASTYHELFINESVQSPDDYATSVVTNGNLRLGASRSETNFFGGDVAELIVYRQRLNQAQKIIVENSLASKYGISIATDRYDYDLQHKYDVAGIGQVNTGNQHTEAQSAATLSIGNPTDLDDGEFVLFGHDNGDISAWTDTERPNNDPDVRRIAREWRVDLSGGDPGMLTLTLNDSILPGLLAGFSNYTLWTDTDGDFSSGAVAVPLVKANGGYIANTVSLSDGIYITVSAIMPVVGFSQDSSSGPESLSNPDIEVALNHAVNEEISVVFRAIDGSATGGGTDYLLNPGSATFPAGTTTTYIQPVIIDDSIVEADKDFHIRLSDPDEGLILSADSNHTYTILNDDISVSAATDTDTIGACGLLSAGLSATVMGTGPFVYAWTPGAGLSDDSIAAPTATPATDTWYKVTVTDQTNGAIGTDSVHITVIPVPAKPTITAGGATTFCEGDSVLLSASPGYSWLWSNGETTQDVYIKTVGSYTVRVIDEYGCTSDPSDPEAVTVNSLPAAPVITASGDTDICPGDSVDLTSSDGDQYLWSTTEATKTIRVKSAGEYYVRIRSTEGCWSDTSLYSVVSLKTPPSAPAITASGPTDICPGDSVDLSSSTGVTWLWSNGDTTQSIRIRTAGSFSVQVTDATTCLSEPSAAESVTVKTPPAAPVITASGPTDICPGDSVELTSSAGETWLWSTGDTTRSIHVKTADSYTVQVTDATTCLSDPSAPVTVGTQPAPGQPDISFSGSTEFCEGDSLVLTSSAGNSYLWSTGDTTASIAVRMTGDYDVRVSNAIGCFSIGSGPVSITVNPLPGQPVISGDTEYCEGDSVLLSTGTAASWLWSTGDTNSSIYTGSGSYTVTITDANGCVSPPSAAHNISENTGPASPLITGDGSYCEGDSGTLSTASAAAYSWSTGESSASIRVTEGSYTVIVFDENGCSSPTSDPFQVTELPAPAIPVITASGPLEFWIGDSVILTSSPENSYLWSPDGETTRDITVKTAGDYSVSVSDENGCESPPSTTSTVSILTLEKPLISVEGETEFCEGSTPAVLSADEASAYEWSTGDTSQSISVSSSGSYTVRIFSDTGLPSELSDPVAVTVHPSPTASLIGKTDVECNGDLTGSAMVTASGGSEPYSWMWQDGQTAEEAVGLGAGDYIAKVWDAMQCQDTVRVKILEPEAIQILADTKDPYCSDAYDGSIEIIISGGTPPYFSMWSDGTTGEILEEIGPGNYSLEVTDGNQCTENAGYTLDSENENCITVPGIITPNNDGYNDTWRIPGIEYYPNSTVEIYDRWGKQIFFSRGYDRPWDGIHDGKLLPMASYHYIINLGNGSPAIVGNITIVK
jgi:gliding motility-associated-like protein